MGKQKQSPGTEQEQEQALTGPARLAQIHGRLRSLNYKIAKLRAERDALILERNELEASGH